MGSLGQKLGNPPAMGSATRTDPMEDWIAQARFIDAQTRISWYLIEFDGQDRFFGLMVGKHAVAGEFALSELESIQGKDDPQAVRLDTEFQPMSLLELARSNEAVAQLLPPSRELLDLKT